MKNINKINWTDGMLITQAHFRGLYEYIDYHDGISQYMIFGGELNYGLIKTDPDQNALELQLINDEVNLLRLNALFKNGTLINYNSSQYNVSLKLSADSLKNLSDLNIVSVYLDESTALFGDADAQEFPPRLPYIDKRLKLICAPWNEYMVANYEATYLPIGVLKNENGVQTLSDQYIPPSLNVKAHPILQKKFKEYHSTLFNIYQYALNTSQIARDSLISGRLNALAQSLQFISERLSDYIANHIDSYKLTGSALPTWEWYLLFKKLGRNLSNSFTSLKSMEAQDVKNFIHQWAGVKPNELSQCIQNIIDDEYNPKLINKSIQYVDALMNTIDNVFKELKKLREFEMMNTMPFKDVETVTKPSIPETETNSLPFKL